MNPSQTGSYNNVFERLVKDQSDVIGSVAYMLYKHDKRAYMRDLNIPPGDPRAQDYHTRLGAAALDGFRSVAFQTLAASTAREIAVAHEKARKEILDELEKAKADLDTLIRNESKFSKGVLASFLASLLLGTAVVLFVHFKNVDFGTLPFFERLMPSGGGTKP